MDTVSFIKLHEGTVKHLYKDTRDLITCGVGFYLPNKKDLGKLTWDPNLQAAEADWEILKGQPAAHGMEFYKNLTRARLSDDTIDTYLSQLLFGLGKQLQSHWDLTKLPETAQTALLDMAYNLGVGGLAKYKKLHDAVYHRDWLTAANECRRNGVATIRNIEVAQLFKDALLG